jgi:hypothetical protein
MVEEGAMWPLQPAYVIMLQERRGRLAPHIELQCERCAASLNWDKETLSKGWSTLYGANHAPRWTARKPENCPSRPWGKPVPRGNLNLNETPTVVFRALGFELDGTRIQHKWMFMSPFHKVLTRSPPVRPSKCQTNTDRGQQSEQHWQQNSLFQPCTSNLWDTISMESWN